MTKGTFRLSYQTGWHSGCPPPSAAYYKKDKAYPLLYSKHDKEKSYQCVVICKSKYNKTKQNLPCCPKRQATFQPLIFFSLYIYGLLYKSYDNTMVHSIEITKKIWTNIYSKTHPQWKYFCSKLVTYDEQSLYAQTLLKLWVLFWLEERDREGGTRKRKHEHPQLLKSECLFNENEGLNRKMSWHVSGCCKHFRDGTGAPLDRKSPGPHLPLGKAQPSIF